MSGLTRHDLESIDGLLARIEASDLYAWLGVDPDTNTESLDALLKERRGWAQNNQANNRFKDEARWIIRHYGLLQRVLLEQGPAYRDALRRSHLKDAEGLLSTLIRGALASGRLTSSAESLIQQKGRELGLNADDISWLVDEALFETGAARADEEENHNHIIELTDAARGAALQGLLDQSTISRIRRRGVGLGLREETVDGIIDVARERAARSSSSLGTSDDPEHGAFGSALRGVGVSRKLDPSKLDDIRRRGMERNTEMRPEEPPPDVSQGPVGDDAFEQLVRSAWEASQAGELDNAGIQRLITNWSNRGIPESVVGHVIAQVLEQGDDNRLAGEDPFAVLEVQPGIDPESLRAAFRERYRWARDIADKRRSTAEISRLEDAFRRAQDPLVRRQYADLYARRAAAEQATAEAAALDEYRKQIPPPQWMGHDPDDEPGLAASELDRSEHTDHGESGGLRTLPAISMTPPPPPPGIKTARAVMPANRPADPRPGASRSPSLAIPSSTHPAVGHASAGIGGSPTLDGITVNPKLEGGHDFTLHWWIPVATFLVGAAVAAVAVLVLFATGMRIGEGPAEDTQAVMPIAAPAEAPPDAPAGP